MKKGFVTAVAVMILIYPLFSQGYKGQGRLKGVITDTEGNPIEGVTVKLFSMKANSGFETKSDKNGEWKANWIRGGMWHIDFSKVGYEPKKISATLLEFQKNPDVEIVMKKVEGIALTHDIVKAVEEANKVYDEERYEEAIAAYEKILTDYPDAFIVNQNIGNAYFALKDYDKAIEFYNKVLEKQEQHSTICVLIGNAFINKKDNEKAMEWYSKVKAEDIEDAIALYNIGILFFNNGNYEKAVIYLKQSVEVDDQFADGYYQLGMSYLASGKNQEAVDVLKKFIELDPDSEKAQTAMSIIDTLTRK